MLYLEKWTEYSLKGQCYTLYKKNDNKIRVIKRQLTEEQAKILIDKGIEIK